MNMKSDNKAIMVAKFQWEAVLSVNSEMMDYTNRIMMVTEIRQEIERYTNTNSDVETNAIISGVGPMDTSNRVLLCLQNMEFLFKRRVLFEAELRRIIVESNSALIIRNNNERIVKKKKHNTVPDEILQAILSGGEEAIPAMV